MLYRCTLQQTIYVFVTFDHQFVFGKTKNELFTNNTMQDQHNYRIRSIFIQCIFGSIKKPTKVTCNISRIFQLNTILNINATVCGKFAKLELIRIQITTSVVREIIKHSLSRYVTNSPIIARNFWICLWNMVQTKVIRWR